MAPRLPPIDVARTPLLVMSEPQKTDLFGAPGHHRQQSVELDNIWQEDKQAELQHGREWSIWQYSRGIACPGMGGKVMYPPLTHAEASYRAADMGLLETLQYKLSTNNAANDCRSDIFIRGCSGIRRVETIIPSE